LNKKRTINLTYGYLIELPNCETVINPWAVNEGLADSNDTRICTLEECLKMGMSRTEFEEFYRNQNKEY